MAFTGSTTWKLEPSIRTLSLLSMSLYWRFCETVHGLDENVGRILNHLDESGLSENTIVLYLGDNGFHLGEHGFYDKRDAFEHSIRVPLLAYAPGQIEAGTKVEEIILNIDLAPTLLEFAGIKKPSNTPAFRRMFLQTPSRWRADPTNRGEIIFFMNITGSGISQLPPRSSLSEPTATNLSTTTVFGIRMAFMI